LAADTVPTFTTSGDPVAKITSSGKLPGGVKFVDNGDGTATLSGRPGGRLGLVGDYSLTFTASNGVLPTGTQNFTLTITRPPRITSVNNATFVVGTAKNLYNYDSEFGAQIDRHLCAVSILPTHSLDDSPRIQMRIVSVTFLLLWWFQSRIDQPDLRIVRPGLSLVLILLDPLLAWHLLRQTLAEMFANGQADEIIKHPCHRWRR
jgi:hypothetical protein